MTRKAEVARPVVVEGRAGGAGPDAAKGEFARRGWRVPRGGSQASGIGRWENAPGGAAPVEEVVLVGMEQIGRSPEPRGPVGRIPGGLKTLVLTGVVTLGGTGVVVATRHDGGDSSALRATCAGADGGAVASTQVACSTVLPAEDDTRTQIIDLASPDQVALKFSFCNGLTCGDVDPECYSNKWIPSFSDQVPASITLPVPDGLTIGKVTVGSAAEPGAAYAKGSDVTIGTGADGQAHIQLNVVGHELAHVVQKTNGRVCGITQEEKDQLEQTEGTALNGQKTRSVRVVVEWHGPTSTPLPGTVRLNEGNPVGLPGSP